MTGSAQVLPALQRAADAGSRLSVRQLLERGLLTALLVFAAGQLGAQVLRDDSGVVAWWPVAGISVALLVRAPRRWWSALLVAIAAGTLASNLLAASRVDAVGYLLANLVECSLAAHLLLRGRRPGDLLRDSADSVRLAVAAVTAVATSSCLVAALRVLTEGPPVVPSVRSYALSHLLGLLMLTPPLLLLPARSRLLQELRSWSRDAEWAMQLAVSCAVAFVVFCTGERPPLTFLFLLPLLWGAARLGPLRAMLSFLVAATMATQGTLAGRGPIAEIDDPLHRLLVLQLLLCSSAVVVLSTVLSARARLQAHDEVVRREEVFRRTFDDALLGVGLLELRPGGDARLTRLNPAGARILGTTESPPSGALWNTWVAPEDEAAFRTAVSRLAADPAAQWHGELRHVTAAGERFLELAMAPWPEVDGVRPGVLQIADVTARRELEQRLRGLALHDALTGLPNRALLTDRLDHALGVSRRSRRHVGLLYLDLDGFKQVNDEGGHAAGDQLLVQVAVRLRAAVRPGDTVARLGGDEFVVVCTDVPDTAAAQLVAARITDQLRAPFLVDGLSFRVGASVGLSLSRSGSSGQQLLREADEAMYVAKRAGKDRVHVAARQQPALHGGAPVGTDLAGALGRGELVLHGQPVCDLATGAVVAVETLLYWRHPSRGLVPVAGLELAETAPPTPAMDRFALEGSCRLAAQWATRLGTAAPDVHVNISGRQIATGSFGRDVAAALAATGLPATRLVLELSESRMPGVGSALLRDLEQLRGLGARLAVDDLGTGCSSLTRVTELPVDMLKIDRTFVAGLGRPAGSAVVRAVLGMGSALGMSVIAEGVETREQVDLLAGWGCDTVQGGFYSSPLPEDELLAFLAASLSPA